MTISRVVTNLENGKYYLFVVRPAFIVSVHTCESLFCFLCCVFFPLKLQASINGDPYPSFPLVKLDCNDTSCLSAIGGIGPSCADQFQEIYVDLRQSFQCDWDAAAGCVNSM
jgi:hypothetical protein